MRALLAVAVALLLWPAALQAAPLKVVATFTILADMVRQIGGDQVVVTTLVGPDGDAHVYEPSPADAKAVAQAGLLVENGLGMEGWIDRLGHAAGYAGPVVVASAGITPRQRVEDGRPQTDPHAWQDLALGRRYAATIAAGLATADPAHAAFYDANATRYATELTALDEWVRTEVAAVPPAKRQIITTHDAFGYFGAAYGVTVQAPEGLSTDAEVTAKGLGTLVTQIRRTGIRALFIENMSDPRMMQVLAKEAGAVIGGTLYVDALSPPTGPAPTYVAMFRHNVTVLCAAMRQNGGP